MRSLKKELKMTKKTPILLDSSAILKWTQQAKGWDRIKELLELAEDNNENLLMSQINLCEVYSKTIKMIGIDEAKKFLETFYLLPITVSHPSEQIIWKSGEIKAEYSISLANCFAIAIALKEKATIITSDPAFKKVQKLVDIEWI